MNQRKRRYIQIALCLAVLLIIGGTMLLNSPRVQQKVSVLLATELENHIGTRVSLGGIRWLFPTDIVIDSISIDDQEGEQLLAINRLAAKIEWGPLLRHRRISVRNIRLFGPEINLYEIDDEGKYNYQFLIDAFASKEKKKKRPLNLSLRVNTLIMRDGKVRHQGSSLPNFNIEKLSTQFALKELSTDSVSLIVRQLGFREQSGLQLDNLYFRLVGNPQGITLANFQLDMPHSTLRLDTIWAAYSTDKLPSSIVYKGGIRPTSYFTPSDFSFALPQLKGITERVYLGCDFIGSSSRIHIKELDIHSLHRDLTLKMRGKVENLPSSNNERQVPLHASIQLSECTLTDGLWSLLSEDAPELTALIPKEIVRVGNITTKGDILLEDKRINAEIEAQTDAGNLAANIAIDNKGHYVAALDGDRLDIARIIPTSPLIGTNITLHAEGDWGEDTRPTESKLPPPFTAKIRVDLTHTQLLDYEYEHITIGGDYTSRGLDADITLTDPCGNLTLQATYDVSGRVPHYSVTLDADSLDLHTFGLIDIHEGNTFSTQLTADLRGNDIDHIIGKIIVNDLTMHRPTDDYLIREIALYASDPENKMLSLQADFMQATVRGAFTYRSLANSLLEHLHHSLPTLGKNLQHHHEDSDNLCLINIGIHDAAPLQELLLQPVDLIGKAQLDLIINDPANELKLNASIPHIVYDGNTIKTISLECHSLRQGLDLLAGATLYDNANNAVTANIVTRAANDKLDLGALWNSNPTGKFEGTFHTQATFAIDDNDGSLTTFIQADSTCTTLNNSKWELDPFRLEIGPEHILIEGLHFANDTTQHLSADGVIARHDTDTLQVSFQNLDLGYLLTMVKLEGISFDGAVSGHAEIANLYTEQPHVEATIEAQDFEFCEGLLGDVDGHIHWNQEASQLQFAADVWESPHHTTVVDGRVDFAQDELWIDIAADSTNVSFLNNLLKSFMNDVKGHAYGNLTVGGPLDALNLSGALLTDVDFNLTPTDVRYHFRDSLRFTPDVIHFNNIEAFDHRNQKAIVNGTVKHNAIKDFAADLYVDAQNVLGVDLPDTGHDSFYTTIYGTGGVHITASPTEPLVIDIQAQSEKGSIFALNLAPDSESQSDQFITFTDRSDTRNTPTIATRTPNRQRRRLTEELAPTTININAQITPDAMLKLVMNQAVDDHISISGSGDLQISAQGSDINLFGTYTANRGFYRLNLQDVINKSFDVQPGSTVSFDGDYMDARLNITARHTVNYVPLKDLTPEMTGNAHVNCLLRIGGTLSAPTLTFDLELPKGTEEEKAVLRSYTSTEEQMTLQFIYLLGLGKFYTPDIAQNTQGTANVESFISSTISGQINNLLSNIISNDNWNFASNLRAENMMSGESNLGGDNLGGNNWENMEIEGILEGRLLDNRLLINGSFGYRDNPMYASNFIGDFDIRYLLTGGFSLKGYNKTNDRYFSRTSLTTQGLGIVFQRDFDRLLPRRRQKKNLSQPQDTTASNPAFLKQTP